MPAVNIPRERWAEFLDTFSRQHRAWLTTIEPAVRAAHARPLRAVEPVRQGGILAAIDISFAGNSEGDTVRVDHPVALWLHQTAEGADLAIEITDDEGVCTRLGFRTTTAASNMLDGIAPGELIDSDTPGERRGAQHESPAEREAKKNPANKQDLEKPSEGRDKPPDETVEKGKRSPDSPWMGGG